MSKTVRQFDPKTGHLIIFNRVGTHILVQPTMVDEPEPIFIAVVHDNGEEAGEFITVHEAEDIRDSLTVLIRNAKSRRLNR